MRFAFELSAQAASLWPLPLNPVSSKRTAIACRSIRQKLNSGSKGRRGALRTRWGYRGVCGDPSERGLKRVCIPFEPASEPQFEERLKRSFGQLQDAGFAASRACLDNLDGPLFEQAIHRSLEGSLANGLATRIRRKNCWCERG